MTGGWHLGQAGGCPEVLRAPGRDTWGMSLCSRPVPARGDLTGPSGYPSPSFRYKRRIPGGGFPVLCSQPAQHFQIPNGVNTFVPPQRERPPRLSILSSHFCHLGRFTGHPRCPQFPLCKMEVALVPTPGAGMQRTHCLPYGPRKYKGLDCPHGTAEESNSQRPSALSRPLEEKEETAPGSKEPTSETHQRCGFFRLSVAHNTGLLSGVQRMRNGERKSHGVLRALNVSA